LTYMFITHDLSVVKHISDEIMVMYLGQSVEHATSEELFENPLHPYTKALFSAIPEPNLSKRGQELSIIRGEVTSPINPEEGCRFASRCEQVMDICRSVTPPYIQQGEGHHVACHLYTEGEG